MNKQQEEQPQENQNQEVGLQENESQEVGLQEKQRQDEQPQDGSPQKTQHQLMFNLMSNPKIVEELKYPPQDFLSPLINCSLTEPLKYTCNNMLLDLFKFVEKHYELMLHRECNQIASIDQAFDKERLAYNLPGYATPRYIKQHVVEAVYAFLDERIATGHSLRLANVAEHLSGYYGRFFSMTPALSGNITYETRNPRHPDFNVLKHSCELKPVLEIDALSQRVWILMNIAIYSFYKYLAMLIMYDINTDEYTQNFLQHYTKFEHEHNADLVSILRHKSETLSKPEDIEIVDD